MTKKREDLSAAERKAAPIARGALDYFPDALLEVARLSLAANEQHNPGEPMHWAKGKSTDEADALLRHLIDRGTIDTDGQRHSAKVAWRALALLQRELEAEAALDAAGVPQVGGVKDWPVAWIDGEDRSGEAPEVIVDNTIPIRYTSEDDTRPRRVRERGHWVDGTWVKGPPRKRKAVDVPFKPRVI